MAEIVVSAIVNVLIEKLISGDLMNLARSEGIDSQLKKWKKTLPLIQAVLVDAGQKHITQRAVELWLHELQDLAYDIDDVIDDLATEALRRKLNQELNASMSTSKVLKIIPTCCTNYTPHNIMYGRKISSKLDEITSRLHDLVEEKNNLGLDVNVKVERLNRKNRGSGQTSLIDESKVLGREGDKEALLEKLFADEACNQNVSVVSIVGLGGIGKTTLAKVLYNEEKVKAHFELRAWVCVSDEFDVFNISKAIFQAVTGTNGDFANLDLLHVALKEQLVKKRFLVVLDDVWNEDHSEWELLQSPFVVGAPGSKVIVTTRKMRVASVMNSFQPYNLKVLSDEIALSLFAQYALGEHNFDNHPSLKLIAEGIIKKCDGLPLALIALGRVLKTKGSDDEWEELLNSEIWDLEDDSGILPALKLSYYDLPPPLKQLFAYCSLFPKDYWFDKNELVPLWMAEGFLSGSKGNKSMESLGLQYFEELQSRSFFQPLANKNFSVHTMHDLMNDLAISVAGEFFFMLDDKMDVNGRNEAFDKFRHFSFIAREHQVHRKFKELHRARCLRTILTVTHTRFRKNYMDNVYLELLPQLQFLRVLCLKNNTIREVPQSIGGLKHLRYLNLSRSSIERIPEQVSDLYNLQSLLLNYCDKLSSLPVSFVKLTNLRHLDISGTPLLNKTPLGIGGLTSLQTLSKVCIERANGFKLSELKGLPDLQGQLSIKGLDKVIDATEAKDANIQQKKGLDDLEMEWSNVYDDSRNSLIEYEVLEKLKPHSKLKKLAILFYGGMKFPRWVGDPSFDELTELTLEGCRGCTHLPTLGHLRSLRELYVSGMDDVKTIGFELLAPTKPFHGIAFPLLESFTISDMQGLEVWSTSGDDNDEIARLFPRLLNIYIAKCPKLVHVSIALIPSLQLMFIEGCYERVSRAIIGVSSSILNLTLYNLKGLTQLHEEVLKHLGSVRDLKILSCDELRFLWESESEACKFLVNLECLEVHECKNLVSLGEKEINVGSMESVQKVYFYSCGGLERYDCSSSVETLMLYGCTSLTSLTFSTLQDQSSSQRISDIQDCDNIESAPDKGFGFLPHFSLRYLDINLCESLKPFPYEHFQRLASLEELKIYDCHNMDDSFPCGLWPPNLKVLGAGCLNKPMSKWGLQNYPTSLVNLDLLGKDSGVVSFAMEEDASNATSACFLLPSSLTSLTIRQFMDVESLSEVLKHLTRLQDLTIMSCPNLRDLPETTSSLRVWVS